MAGYGPYGPVLPLGGPTVPYGPVLPLGGPSNARIRVTVYGGPKAHRTPFWCTVGLCYTTGTSSAAAGSKGPKGLGGPKEALEASSPALG